MFDKYDYDYEWDVHYCYENSNVLRNKLNITDAAALHTAEREISAVTVIEARQYPIRGQFNFKHLCDIHRFIFGDIYEWAGKLRTVNIAKGNPFCNCNVLDVYGAELFGKLKAEKYLQETPPERIAERLAHYLSEINVLHPFREGNGRVQRVFIEYLALAAGYRVDFADVTAAEMVDASVRAFDCDETLMRGIFERVTTPITEQERRAAHAAIRGSRGNCG